MTGVTLPASWYRDRVVYDAERERVFASTWQLVAHAAQLREPGASVSAEVAGWPLLIVRHPNGGLRAFHDVCRHRAGPLACSGSALVCRYHGWTYDLDGALIRARDFGDDPALSEEGIALHRVRVETWRGLVFVLLAGDGDLDDALGGFAHAAEAFPIESFVFDGAVVHEVRCNWKTYADNYLEGYHIPLVHPDLDASIDSRRYQVDVHEDGRWMRHSAPSRDGGPASGQWLWRYPNLALNVYRDGMNVERFLPVGPDRVLVSYWYFFAKSADRASVESSRKMSAQLLDEDRAICEAVQRNLDAGIYEHGPLSPRHEVGVAAFQRWLRDAVADRAEPRG